MGNDREPSFFEKGALTKYLAAEYHPLEALLACIIDAQKSLKSPPSREVRIRDAFKALTGQKLKRVDDPSGKHARALYRMAEYQYEIYRSQILPEHGGTDGPALEEQAYKTLATRACQELDLPLSDIDILVRKYNARYGKDRRGRTEGYAMLSVDRFNSFNGDSEKRMLRDFRTVAAILASYGIGFEFKDVFWRTLGKESESVPSTS